MKLKLSAILLVAFAAGCSFGMTAKKFRPAQGPAGIQTRIITPLADLNGELLEIRDNGLVVLTSALTRTVGDRSVTSVPLVRLVPFGAIQRATFDQLGPDMEIANGQLPSREALARLRLMSRFPYGISEPVLARLLKEYGQASLGGIDR